MYKDGWWLAMRLPRIPWLLDPEALRHFGPGWDPDADPVELYYLPDDFSQARNLADEQPEKVEELRSCSGRRPSATRCCRSSAGSPPSTGSSRRSQGVEVHLPGPDRERRRRDDPRIYNHSYTISADLVVPEGGAEGVIVAAFDHLGGFALYVQDGKLKHHYSMLGVLEYTQESEAPLPEGEVTVEMVFAADEPKPATGSG